MKRKVHRAFVEECVENGMVILTATCAKTHIRSDWVWFDPLWPRANPIAFEYVVECLSGKRGADVFCDAEHVL